MADGKTVEEVARALVDRWRFDTLAEPNDATLQDAIAIALRQREQETAETCARIIAEWRDGITYTSNRGRFLKASNEAFAIGAIESILSRFPKAEG